MQFVFTKKIIISTIVVILIVVLSIVLIFKNKSEEEIVDETPMGIETNYPIQKVIGTSVEGRSINSYTYGNGENHILFVGGIHGGYEWNSVLLAYSFIDYLDTNPNFIPSNITVSIIPSANPDGIYKVIGKDGRFSIVDVPTIDSSPGRFNANKVDLNRNFDCKWQPTSMWRGNVVNAGSSAFSEPESLTIKNFVLENKPDSVIFWHSQANAVYASQCQNGILPDTLKIMNAYAKASGYTPINSFDAYEVTGDAEGWLASINIPAITVELKTHETVEWEQNLAGVKALLEFYR